MNENDAQKLAKALEKIFREPSPFEISARVGVFEPDENLDFVSDVITENRLYNQFKARGVGAAAHKNIEAGRIDISGISNSIEMDFNECVFKVSRRHTFADAIKDTVIIELIAAPYDKDGRLVKEIIKECYERANMWNIQTFDETSPEGYTPLFKVEVFVSDKFRKMKASKKIIDEEREFYEKLNRGCSIAHGAIHTITQKEKDALLKTCDTLAKKPALRTIPIGIYEYAAIPHGESITFECRERGSQECFLPVAVLKNAEIEEL